MLPYYSLIGIPIIIAIYNEYIYEKNGRIGEKKNYTVVSFFLIYFLLLGMRSAEIGSDTKQYIDIYHYISGCEWQNLFSTLKDSEKGFIVLNKIIATISNNNEQLLLFVIAGICIIPIAILYYKETKNSLVSIALFLVFPIFQMNFSGLRQAIAMALVVPALYFIKEKSILKFIGIVFVAMLFHKSAFIILCMYPLYHLRLNFKHILFIAPIGGCFFIFNRQIYLFLVKFVGNEFAERYSFTEETGAYTMLILYVIFAIYAFVAVNENKLTENEKGFRNFLVMAVFLQMLAPVNPIVMRMNYYFIIFIPIVITQITHNNKIFTPKTTFFVNTTIFFVFIAYYINKANHIDSLNIYPYEFFWTHN